MIWSGAIVDDVEAVSIMVCTTTALLSTCVTIPALPGDTAQGTWQLNLAGLLAGDGVTTTLTLYGMDGAGNLAPPLSRSFRVDTVRPVLTVSGGIPAQVYVGEPLVMGGLVSDGGGVSGLTAVIVAPDGDVSLEPISLNGSAWQHTLTFSETGQFIVYLEARDNAGNTRSAGPFGVAVLPPGEPSYQLHLPLIFR
jgi:hypothetical protein